MFEDILLEANVEDHEDPFNFNKDGKIPALEEAFKDDPVALKVSYMIATSHEYDKPNVEAAINMVKNYSWEETNENVENIQGIDKPVRKEKVFEIATKIKEEGMVNNYPLIVVDKLHGITPQSEGKKILFDGHHRKEALNFLNIKSTKVYKGTYTGDAQKDLDALIEEAATATVLSPDLKQKTQKYQKNLSELRQIKEDYDKTFMKLKEAKEKNDEVQCRYYTTLLSRYEKDIERLKDENSKLRKILGENVDELIEASKEIEPVPLTEEERNAVKEKYGDVKCSFHKDTKTGKYFCKTHRARSKMYDSPTDIPKDQVDFISSTS